MGLCFVSSASGAETTLLGLYMKFLVRGASESYTSDLSVPLLSVADLFHLVLLLHLRFKLEDKVLWMSRRPGAGAFCCCYLLFMGAFVCEGAFLISSWVFGWSARVLCPATCQQQCSGLCRLKPVWWALVLSWAHPDIGNSVFSCMTQRHSHLIFVTICAHKVFWMWQVSLS